MYTDKDSVERRVFERIGEVGTLDTHRMCNTITRRITRRRSELI